MIYGLDSSTAKRQEANLELAEIRFSVSVASLDRIVNEYIWGTAEVLQFGDKEADYVLGWHLKVQLKEDRKEGGSN